MNQARYIYLLVAALVLAGCGDSARQAGETAATAGAAAATAGAEVATQAVDIATAVEEVEVPIGVVHTFTSDIEVSRDRLGAALEGLAGQVEAVEIAGLSALLDSVKAELESMEMRGSAAGIEAVASLVDQIDQELERLKADHTDVDFTELEAAVADLRTRVEDLAESGPSYPGDEPVGPPVTTESGLIHMVITEGAGATPEAGQRVSVHYTGYLMDGTEFDSSVSRGQPFEFVLGTGQVIRGWDEGLALMRVGDKRKLIVPADLGYGPGGFPPVIPANAVLVFDVEFLGIQ